MTAPTNNKFRCRYCGDHFALSSDEFKDYINGGLEEPDTCDDCLYNLNNPDEIDYFSDADPGL
jgi:hypothetical protein